MLNLCDEGWPGCAFSFVSAPWPLLDLGRGCCALMTSRWRYFNPEGLSRAFVPAWCSDGRENGPRHSDCVRNRFRFIASMLDEPTPINVARARAAARNHADPFPHGEPRSFRYRAFYFLAKGRVLPWAPGQ